jgi:hypothetical protein
MKHTKLALAVGFMLTASAMQSWALAPAAVPTANRLYVSGATATDQMLGRLMVAAVADGGFCQAGSIDVYAAAADPGGTDAARLQAIFGATNKAVLCTASTATSQSGTPIGLYKESTAGSENGVDPVALGTNTSPSGAALNFLNLDSAAPFGCGAGVAFPAIAGQTVAFTAHFSCGTVVQRAPHVGVSDVNPSMLSANQAVLDNLTFTGTVDVVFAPAVTLRLYRELQAAQGLESSCSTDDNGFADGDGTGDCDEPLNVPSLTSSQIRAIMTGAYQNWNLMTSDAGTQLPSSQVIVCRRGNTSGTEATFESVMLNQRCSAGVQPMSPPTDLACEAGGCAWTAARLPQRVFAGTGSGDVRNCLIGHDDNATERAFGILSMESSPPNLNSAGPDGNAATTTDRGWRYIGINRVNPELLTAMEGNWELWTENTWNVPNGSPGLARTTEQDTLQSDIQTNLGNLTVIKNINEGFAWKTGQGALLGQPGNPNAAPVPPFTRNTALTTPVNPMTRTPGSEVNNCNPPIVRGTRTEHGGLGEEVPAANANAADVAP